jgi:hypothetical protein
VQARRAGVRVTARTSRRSTAISATTRLQAALAGIAAGLALAAPAAGELVAARIEAANHARLRAGGPDAAVGLGDWALSNGTLCAGVSDPTHENDLSVTGGTLMDLGRCGRGDDQFLVFEQLVNLSTRTLVPITRVVAEQDASEARLVTHGALGGLALETRYAVDLTEPTRLRIRSRVERVGPGDPLFAFATALANINSLTPFTLDTRGLGPSRGFTQRPFFGLDRSAIASVAVPADLLVLVGDAGLSPGIAYAVKPVSAQLERASGERTPLPRLLLADDVASISAVFVRPFWIGDGRSLGLLQLLQAKLMDLAAGDAIVIEQEIWIGDRPDVASATARLWAAEPLVRGQVDDPRASLAVDDAQGRPAIQARPDADGGFEMRLPRGSYSMRARAPGGREASLAFRVEAPELELGRVQVGAPAQVRLPRGEPMRLAFLGQDGTPDPKFGDDLLGFTVEARELRRTAGVRDLSLAGTAADPESVAVPPGRYRVLATRGPEFSVTETRLELSPGATVPLEIEPPRRVLATPGWISADFHVHAAPSPDTALALPARLASYTAEGAEVIVSTDHDMITDYAPLIRELGLAGRMASIVGSEITSEVKTDVAPNTLGHANAFPLPLAPLAYRGGAVPNEGRRWRDVIADLNAIPGERVIQLNHARTAEGELHARAYFSHLTAAGAPYDPSLPLTAAPNSELAQPDPKTGVRDIDFDAMELLNGARVGAYPALREDWFSLLRQGVVLTATANSDSHTLQNPVAAPRNFVSVRNDGIAAFDQAAFVKAIREGRSYGSTGPLLELTLGEAGIGDRFRGREGLLRLRVNAAPWVPVRQARVFLDGRLMRSEPIAAGGQLELPLRFERDGFVTVEVEGSADATYSALLPKFAPFAFSNPIFVDADGDGSWTPPGLP